jgi:threonylcarbamoyladenosine tRNA methylthiotransferase MtaB
MRIRLEALGCRLNISEMEALGRDFVRAGHVIVGEGQAADLYVINTCTVTHVADRKSRQAIRRLAAVQPGACLVVTGCYAQVAAEIVRALPGVDLVVGNEDKGRIPEIVREKLAEWVKPSEVLETSEVSPEGGFPGPAHPATHTRAFLKVQDGCDNRCTFCVITLARGRSRSRPIPEVLSEVQALLEAGYREVVLTGVHLGSYGRDLSWCGVAGLAALVRSILEQTAVERLRLSSLEPWDLPALGSDFFGLWADGRLCRHLHLPLQSGCDATLRRMGRGITTAEFAALAESARRAIPGLSLTTDIIVGFPGETEKEFRRSLRFVEEMRFSRLHVFPYSPRPGTAAARFPDRPPPDVARERGEAMRRVGELSGRLFCQQFIGQAMEVLWESATGSPPRWQGLTDNYIRVVAESASHLRNTITRTMLTGLANGGVCGEILGRDRRPGEAKAG